MAERSCRRHRLRIPTHLAGKVGEATTPGPIGADDAEDLADILDMCNEGMPVSWRDGMTAKKARELLAEHHASLATVPPTDRSVILLDVRGTMSNGEGRDQEGNPTVSVPTQEPNSEGTGIDIDTGTGIDTGDGRISQHTVDTSIDNDVGEDGTEKFPEYVENLKEE